MSCTGCGELGPYHLYSTVAWCGCLSCLPQYTSKVDEYIARQARLSHAIVWAVGR